MAMPQAVATRTGASKPTRPGVIPVSVPWSWLLPPIVLFGLLLRLAAAARLPQHLDEGNMLLGIRAVAERGWPLLPSGVLYLHGATISYLLAPFARLGLVDYANLFPLRVVSSLFGALAVYVTYRLARVVTGSIPAGLLAAVLVAADPLSVIWGGFVRMYALLQVLTLLIAWLLVRALAPAHEGSTPTERRLVLAALVVVYWLAVFTQIVTALLWPAMALAALAVCGPALLGRRRDIAAALGLCLLAPLVFLLASTFIGTGSGTARPRQAGGWLPVVSFLGNNRLATNFLHPPDLTAWIKLFPGEAVAPVLVLVGSAVLVGRYLLLAPVDRRERETRRAVATLLLLYWLPILLLTLVVFHSRGRYLLNVQAIGYILAAAGLAAAWARGGEAGVPWRQALASRAPVVGVVALALASFALAFGSPVWALDETDPGLAPSLDYVAAHRQAGDWVIVDSPPEAAVVLGGGDNVRVIGRIRTQPGPTGVPVDDRVGWPALTDTAALCAVLEAHPGTWVVQGHRLDIPNQMVMVLDGAADERFQTPDNFRVLRTRPPATWDAEATRRCHPG
jgi:hypothetical protein